MYEFIMEVLRKMLKYITSTKHKFTHTKLDSNDFFCQSVSTFHTARNTKHVNFMRCETAHSSHKPRAAARVAAYAACAALIAPFCASFCVSISFLQAT